MINWYYFHYLPTLRLTNLKHPNLGLWPRYANNLKHPNLGLWPRYANNLKHPNLGLWPRYANNLKKNSRRNTIHG
ncbi:hypothetical protein [Moorena sp. SIO4G3]|uniref:hypothetical protein n=1 Tax=Moorena sp. SIO4G3 TaxID=2607821 RepID=UPI00142A279D|nr:hypothetical protein [Moorena sp. SIO4G3]NEO74987.1 hypothetical protein [Moorena sp. SIO4G3]